MKHVVLTVLTLSLASSAWARTTLEVQRDAVRRGIGKALQRPAAAKMLGAVTLYEFVPGSIFVVYARPGHVVDVMLQPGEKISGDVHGGDTVRWQIQASSSGSGPTARTHLFIKPRGVDVSTNVIVPTDRRVYHLMLFATDDFYMPGVAWTYGEPGDAPGKSRLPRVRPLSRSELVHTDRHDDAYRVKCAEGRKRATYKTCFDPTFAHWHPSVYDDGTKTILRFPKAIVKRESPVLYVVEPGSKKPRLVNYRVVGNYYVVDRLFDLAQLRLGPTKKIQIIRARRRAASRGYDLRCGRVIPRMCRGNSKSQPSARDDGKRTFVWLPKGTNNRALLRVTPYVGTEPVKLRYKRRGNTVMLPGVYTRIVVEIGDRVFRFRPVRVGS